MPIVEIETESIRQRCVRCGSESTRALSDLTLGSVGEGFVDGNIVPLPPCGKCGAVEFLVRSPEDEPEHPEPGSFGHLHRLLVDHLHAELVIRGDEEELLVLQAKARAVSPETLSRWFPDGLKLERHQPRGPTARKGEVTDE